MLFTTVFALSVGQRFPLPPAKCKVCRKKNTRPRTCWKTFGDLDALPHVHTNMRQDKEVVCVCVVCRWGLLSLNRAALFLFVIIGGKSALSLAELREIKLHSRAKQRRTQTMRSEPLPGWATRSPRRGDINLQETKTQGPAPESGHFLRVAAEFSGRWRKKWRSRRS